MNRNLLIFTLLVTLAIPASCLAGPPRQGGYVSAFIGVSAPRDSNVTGSDFTGPAGSNPSFSDNVEFDTGINVGGTAGYDFGMIRLEGELSYKQSDISAITDKNGFQFGNPDGDLSAFAMMANVFLDLHNASPVTPYLGAGIGFATLYLSDTFVSSGLLYPSDTDTVFAWQAGGGVEIALNRQLSLDLGYRYFATDEGRFNSDPNISANLKMESHTGAVGLRVKF